MIPVAHTAACPESSDSPEVLDACPDCGRSSAGAASFLFALAAWAVLLATRAR